MQRVLCFLFLFSFHQLSAQKAEVGAAMEKIERSLVEGDTAALRSLLHPKLSFGHSNGWVQSSQDVINDLVSGKLRYKKFGRELEQWSEDENLFIVRYSGPVTYILNGTEGNLYLHVVQVWTKTGEGWKLIARQSTKMEPPGK